MKKRHCTNKHQIVQTNETEHSMSVDSQNHYRNERIHTTQETLILIPLNTEQCEYTKFTKRLKIVRINQFTHIHYDITNQVNIHTRTFYHRNNAEFHFYLPQIGKQSKENNKQTTLKHEQHTNKRKEGEKNTPKTSASSGFHFYADKLISLH